MTTPAQNDITVQKGRKWSRTYIFKDSDGVAIDLSSFTFKAQIRKTSDPDSTLIASVAVDDTDAATGQLVVSVDDSAAAITDSEGYWDLVAIDGSSKPWTYLYGYVTLQDMPTVVT